MTQNVAATAIPQPVINDITAKLNDIFTTLSPYLIALSEEDRKTMAKMSDKSVAFVNKVKDYLVMNPQFAPYFLNQAALKEGLTNVTALNPVLQLTLQLANSLSDTTMANGSEAYMSALQYYNFVKQADKNNVPGAKAVYTDLAQRFPSTRKPMAPAKVA